MAWAAGHGALWGRLFPSGILELAPSGIPVMIALKNLNFENGKFYLHDLSLKVENGEIYFLFNRLDRDNDLLFQVLGGFLRPRSGGIDYEDGRIEKTERPASANFIDRFDAGAEFDTEVRLGHWLDFLCALGLRRENIYKTLLVGNFHERQLKKMVRDLAPETFKLAYLAVCLAADGANVVINDFIKGADKSFELKFNKLLLQKKSAGRSILFLGNDIFYASEIADRVGFIKNGRLMFEAAAADLKEMEIKDLYLKFLN
jgi:ABC-type Na+ transport system ATPase subunit NatA